MRRKNMRFLFYFFIIGAPVLFSGCAQNYVWIKGEKYSMEEIESIQDQKWDDWYSCVLRSANKIDDGKSDVISVATAVSQMCKRENMDIIYYFCEGRTSCVHDILIMDEGKDIGRIVPTIFEIRSEKK
jgi:hypothetical protein